MYRDNCMTDREFAWIVRRFHLTLYRIGLWHPHDMIPDCLTFARKYRRYTELTDGL